MGQGPHRTNKRMEDKLQAYEHYMSLPASARSYAAVARDLGIPKATAHRRIKAALELFQETTEQMRVRMFLDTREVQEAMRRKAIGGGVDEDGEPVGADHQAAAVYLKANEQTRKLFGLDAPVRTDLTSDGDKITIMVNPDRLTDQAREELGE